MTVISWAGGLQDWSASGAQRVTSAAKKPPFCFQLTTSYLISSWDRICDLDRNGQVAAATSRAASSDATSVKAIVRAERTRVMRGGSRAQHGRSVVRTGSCSLAT